MWAQSAAEIGKILAAARRHRKLTQAELAHAIGATQAWDDTGPQPYAEVAQGAQNFTDLRRFLALFDFGNLERKQDHHARTGECLPFRCHRRSHEIDAQPGQKMRLMICLEGQVAGTLESRGSRAEDAAEGQFSLSGAQAKTALYFDRQRKRYILSELRGTGPVRRNIKDFRLSKRRVGRTDIWNRYGCGTRSRTPKHHRRWVMEATLAGPPELGAVTNTVARLATTLSAG